MSAYLRGIAGCAAAPWGVLLLLMGNPVQAGETAEHRRYNCTANSSLVVLVSSRTAIVQFPDRVYQLDRRRSSIGIRYGSDHAALMIDGLFATFVADGRANFRRCQQVSPLAERQ